MRLEELFPYWGYAHQQLLDTLEYLSEAQLEYHPHPDTPSVRDIVRRLIREERYWVGTLIARATPSTGPWKTNTARRRSSSKA